MSDDKGVNPLLLVAGIVLFVLFSNGNGGDQSIEPDGLSVTAATARDAIIDYANGLADVYETAADEGHGGEWINEQSKSVRLDAFRKLNQIMQDNFSPDALWEAAEGARGAVE